MQVSKQGRVSLTFLLVRIKSKGSNINKVYLDNYVPEAIFQSMFIRFDND